MDCWGQLAWLARLLSVLRAGPAEWLCRERSGQSGRLQDVVMSQ